MVLLKHVALTAYLLYFVSAVNVKVIMHSEQEDSKIKEDTITVTELISTHKKKPSTFLPFLKHRHKHLEKQMPIEYEEEKVVTEKTKKATHMNHPNELFFPLIYHQNHIKSMFKYGENWYTWSPRRKSDGTKAINFYVCNDEPKQCDDIGWEPIDTIPECALQIDELLPDDRVCVDAFGVEARGGVCVGSKIIQVSDLIKSCGVRIHSLWRFVRVSRRPTNAIKPADVNSFICEDEEECFVSIEYRIHHDRITFTLHEPTRGQTFKSALKRNLNIQEGKKLTKYRPYQEKNQQDGADVRVNKMRLRPNAKLTESKNSIKDLDSIY